jgi:hypothetical protein
MKNIVMLLLAGGLCIGLLPAQSAIGLQFGGLAVQGDLVDSPFDAGEIGFMYGLNYQNQLSPSFGLRAGLTRGRLRANEQDTDRARRGAVLESNLTEIALQLEWHFLRAERYNIRGEFLRSFSPYVGLGIGMAFVNPDPEFKNGFTTRPEEETSSFFVLPIDLGVRLYLSPKWTATLSGGSRPAFSDLLDGVSTNGNPNADDWYLLGGIGFQYQL